MGVKKRSNKGKGSYAAYKAMGSFLKNKKRKVAKHAAQNPNDAVAAEALKNVSAAKIRTTPARNKSRIDSWVLPDGKGEYKFNRARNSFAGKLSAWGKFTQTAAKFSKGVANAKQYDTHGKLFGQPQNLLTVWDGWADCSAPKPTHPQANKKPQHNHKKKQKK